MADKVAGIVSLNINGQVIKVKGSVTYSMIGTELESVVGLDGHHGYSEKFIPQFVEITATVTKNLDIKKITANRDTTCTVLTANKKAVLSGAFVTSQPVTSPETGEITIKWEGTSGSEVNR